MKNSHPIAYLMLCLVSAHFDPLPIADTIVSQS